MIFEQNIGLIIFFSLVFVIFIFYMLYRLIKAYCNRKREKKLIEMMNLISKNNTPNM